MSLNRYCHRLNPFASRRDFLATSATGFGYLALLDLLARDAAADNQGNASAAPASGPMSPRPPHHAARAKRVIFLFMHGGPSQVDTFDYKPQLTRDHGKPLPFDKPRIVSAETDNLLGSPFKFQQYGESGAWVSELFPHVARHVDELCIINSMFGSNSRHGAAAARTSHRQRYVRATQHGLLDQLRAGHRESELAGLHHDLSDAHRTAASTTGVRRSCPPSTREHRSATRPPSRRSEDSLRREQPYAQTPAADGTRLPPRNPAARSRPDRP